MSVCRYLNNPASAAVSFDLPVDDGGLFPAKGSQPTHPKHATAKVGLCSFVVKQQPGFSRQLGHSEIIVHDDENVHIVWL